MKIPPFKLEEFWKKYEFNTPYLLCASDTESWSLNEILKLADGELLKIWEDLSLGYTEVPGHPMLREEISKLYSSIQKEQILTVAGGEEGIYITIQTLIEKGDHVVVIEPCYQSLKTLCESLGAEITTIELKQKNRWKLSSQDLKSALRPSTKLLIINYPHNPTGTLLDREVFESMIQLAKEYGFYIFSDEMYRFLEIEEEKRMPSVADVYERGITLFGMSKPFGLPGLRIGWLATQDRKFLEGAASYKVYTSICNSAPSEILAMIALRQKEIILAKNRNIMQENLAILDAFFHRNRSLLSWVRPESGALALVELLDDIDVETFAQALREKMGVLIMPKSVIGISSNVFRIGFGRKNMPEILELFEQFLKQYNKETR